MEGVKGAADVADEKKTQQPTLRIFVQAERNFYTWFGEMVVAVVGDRL